MTTTRLYLPLAVVLAAATVAPVGAQQPGTIPAPLLLKDAILEALQGNPELVALRREVEVMGAASSQEKYLAPPMFETQIWGWPVTTLNPVRTDMYMFTGEQELPGRGKRAARVLVAERETDVSRRQVGVRANELLNELKQAYVDLALARETSAIYARQAPLLRNLAEAATVRYAAAQSGQQYTVGALVEMTRLQMDLLGSEERARAAEVRLNSSMGRAPGEPVGALVAVASGATVEAIEMLAVARHPETALANASIAREEAELARIRSDQKPDFVIGGGYMLVPGNAGAWTARAGVTWPNVPWARGRLTAAIDAQQRRVIAATARRDAVASVVRRAVRDAAIRVGAAERRERLIASTILPQLEHAFELARVAYAGGDGPFGEVLESRRLIVATEIELASARADANRARADLETAGGVQ